MTLLACADTAAAPVGLRQGQDKRHESRLGRGRTGRDAFSYRTRPCLSPSSHYHTGSQPLALVDLFTPSAASLHRITNASDIRSLLCIFHLHNYNTCIALQTYGGNPCTAYVYFLSLTAQTCQHIGGCRKPKSQQKLTLDRRSFHLAQPFPLTAPRTRSFFYFDSVTRFWLPESFVNSNSGCLPFIFAPSRAAYDTSAGVLHDDEDGHDETRRNDW